MKVKSKKQPIKYKNMTAVNDKNKTVTISLIEV